MPYSRPNQIAFCTKRKKKKAATGYAVANICVLRSGKESLFFTEVGEALKVLNVGPGGGIKAVAVGSRGARPIHLEADAGSAERVPTGVRARLRTRRRHSECSRRQAWYV